VSGDVLSDLLRAVQLRGACWAAIVGQPPLRLEGRGRDPFSPRGETPCARRRAHLAPAGERAGAEPRPAPAGGRAQG
ncbi:MAG TPA: hypothetical protein VL359_10080, partial [bacterium]|nr:hypothetical protein [bacterium]